MAYVFFITTNDLGLPSQKNRWRLADLIVKQGNLLLIRRWQQEATHLCLQRVVDFHINVITSCLLLIIWIHTIGNNLSYVIECNSTIRNKLCFHHSFASGLTAIIPVIWLNLFSMTNLKDSSVIPDDMVYDYRIWRKQQVSETLGYLTELQTRTVKDLKRKGQTN